MKSLKSFPVQKSRVIIILIICLIFFTPMPTAAATRTYTLGTLSPGSVKLVYQNVTLNTYKAYDNNYIATADLQLLGFNIFLTPGKKTINIIAPSPWTKTTTSSGLKITPSTYSFYDGNVYLGNMQTQCLVSGGRTFIPVGALSEFGTLSVSNGICTFTPVSTPPVKATETAIINLTNVSVSATIIDIYWSTKVKTYTNTFTLAPGETIQRQLNLQGKPIHIATLVQGVSGNGIHYTNNSLRGQVNAALMEKYMRLQNTTFLNGYGDPIDESKVVWAQDAMNSKNLSSTTPYLVWTNTSEQRTYIFEGSNHNWTLIKCFICSTGRDSTPTPKGTFHLTRKVPSFGQSKGYCCKYAFGFIGSSYLYHSIIYDKTGTYLLENKGVLGKKASQGCIRFSTDHAKWFYDTMLPNTTVYIS